MWEIFSGCPPFDDRAHDCHLILEICKGLRPPILSNMPKEYVEMMKNVGMLIHLKDQLLKNFLILLRII